jgi:hypothetical protein
VDGLDYGWWRVLLLVCESNLLEQPTGMLDMIEQPDSALPKCGATHKLTFPSDVSGSNTVWQRIFVGAANNGTIFVFSNSYLRVKTLHYGFAAFW